LLVRERDYTIPFRCFIVGRPPALGLRLIRGLGILKGNLFLHPGGKDVVKAVDGSLYALARERAKSLGLPWGESGRRSPEV